VRDEWTSEDDDELDRILGQTTALLAQRGDEQAVALLVDVQYMMLAADLITVRPRAFPPPPAAFPAPCPRYPPAASRS
jgi:hypothetical protein